MVFKIVIKDNKNTPLHYLPDLDNFQNGREYVFTPGVNIIIGENGCGKTTLMKLIRHYLMIDAKDCSRGLYNCNINALFQSPIDGEFLDGVEVFADYQRNTFRLLHKDEKSNDSIMESGNAFYEHFEQLHSSTGESVVIAINSLFNYMFGKNAKLIFDYKQFEEDRPEYWKYIKEHRIEGDEWTILMDEPDRNLSLDNISQIKSILNFHKPQTQIIAVIHNPLLIYSLSKLNGINIIEMTEGYVDKIKKTVNKLIK